MPAELDYAPHLIAGRPVQGPSGAATVVSQDPYDGSVHWSAATADAGLIASAIQAAREARQGWARTPLESRLACIRAFGDLVTEGANDLAHLISRENGKPLWDARTEVNSLVGKIDASVESFQERAMEKRREVRGMTSATRFKAHGTMAVIGPYNFPMSMANSHIMPALLAGNTVVFKPSEFTPLCGLAMAHLWSEAGLPGGVLNCLTGGGAVGSALVSSPDVNGILFIGSRKTGLAIRQELCEQPEKLVALEMGGNNPLVVWDYDDVEAASFCAVQSTMISAGQRCSAARRLIVQKGDDRLVDRLAGTLAALRIGHYSGDPEPYYGPLIRAEAAAHVVSRFEALEKAGGRVLLRPRLEGPNETLVTPGLMDMTGVPDDPDEEIFGPILKIYRVDTVDDAIALANRTRYGLSAGIVTESRDIYDRFFEAAEAGIINWNQQLTGATTFAPFGGIKQSGNHRPAGFLSVDYCSYAVASFENEHLRLPASLPSGLTLTPTNGRDG